LSLSSRTRIVALAVAAAFLAALFPAQAPAAARPAPAFTLELLDGKSLSLAAYKGSPVILLFWAPW
jgi:cytochrome c biogenesis protein CcmG/thiol:disulfide interchange protein DsbE